MLGFFCNWRRAVGAMTLLFACLLVSGWVRSLVTSDEYVLKYQSCSGRYLLRSREGEIQYLFVDTMLMNLSHEEGERVFFRCPYFAMTTPLILLSSIKSVQSIVRDLA